MKILFPTLIYNNKDKACCRCETPEDKAKLVGYFKDELDHSCLPYTQIPASEALRLYSEVVESPVEEPEKDIDLSKLKWHELRAQAKKLGAKLPLKAKRDTVEKAIYEVINGDSK